MAPNPTLVLLIVTLTFGFETALFGIDLITDSFPQLTSPQFGSCGGGGLDKIACVIGGIFNAIIDFFKIIVGVIVLIGNVISFNVPGAPVIVRIPIAVVLISSSAWSIATLIRGN